jgi:hypothetical protein
MLLQAHVNLRVIWYKTSFFRDIKLFNLKFA